MEENKIKMPISNEKNIEHEILRCVNKKMFFKIMAMNKIDFDTVILKKKSFNEHYHKFNCLVKQMCESSKITMIDCAVYLYTDLFQERNVLECFDEENKYNLRQELARKHGLRTDDNVLKNFIE